MAMLARLIGPGRQGQAAWLVALMAASALTEGLGVVLLVPLLAALEPGRGGALSGALARWGLTLSLPTALIAFVVLVLLRAGINQARNAAALKLELGVIDDLRRRAWRALLGADWRTFSAMRRSDSASVLISHIDRAGFGVNQAGTALATLITLGGLAMAGLAVAPLMTLGGGAGGIFILLAYAGMRRRAANLGEALSGAYQAMHASIGESLGAMRAVKSLQGETRAEQAAFSGFAALARARVAYQRDLGLGQILLQAGGAVLMALLVWLAVARWGLSATQILPVAALFARALPLVGQLQECWQNFAYAQPAIRAALELIDRAEAAREPDLALTAPPVMQRNIALRDVSVRYAAEAPAALGHVSLTLPRGSLTALSGGSGAGKSTLADVLAGLINPDEGDLVIDGAALDAAQRRAWRAQVAYVQQDPALLADTVRANLLWGSAEATDVQIAAALRDAACQFVLDWPQGIDTPIGDGGRLLSGGERQRLMLARALLRRPALLILDEATSALDPENELLIASALAALKGRMTILLIAHRGALSNLADQAYQLDRGGLSAAA